MRCAASSEPATPSPAPPTTASARRSYLDDPDGNGVELYWDRPEADWPRDATGGLAMVTRRLDLDDPPRRAPADAGRSRVQRP